MNLQFLESSATAGEVLLAKADHQPVERVHVALVDEAVDEARAVIAHYLLACITDHIVGLIIMCARRWSLVLARWLSREDGQE